MTIVDGKALSVARIAELKRRVSDAESAITLAIIQVGERADSTAFIRAKVAYAKKIGVATKLIALPETVNQTGLLNAVTELNNDRSIQGIIVQLPLPTHIVRDEIIDAIDPRKDVDGLTATNVKRLMSGDASAVIPATARGIRALLAASHISLAEKKVTIVGRSMLVGKPIALMCLNENATVTVCHSKTPDVAAETRAADIVIAAVGKPRLIGRDYVREGQTIIDVGIARQADGSLVGDVDFDAVSPVVAAITPVPGGVGPMTVSALFENLVDLACGKTARTL